MAYGSQELITAAFAKAKIEVEQRTYSELMNTVAHKAKLEVEIRQISAKLEVRLRSEADDAQAHVDAARYECADQERSAELVLDTHAGEELDAEVVDDAAAPSVGSSWVCPCCTFENHHEVQDCEICGDSKDAKLDQENGPVSPTSPLATDLPRFGSLCRSRPVVFIVMRYHACFLQVEKLSLSWT
jgi:hypothetical protein